MTPSDSFHLAAVRWRKANEVNLITSNFVVDETLTLLVTRGEKWRAIELGSTFFRGRGVEIYHLTEEDFQEAWMIFRTHADKNWSFTDCTSKVVMDRLGIHQAFTFDKHFRRFGNVKVLPEGEIP